MRIVATLFAGSAAGMLLAAGAAEAGACSGEIMALQKQMEGTPTMAGNSANSGTAPLPAPNAPPPPAATEPMDSDAAAASQLDTAAGTDTTDTGATGADAAAQALDRARALDQAGDEAGCMNAVQEAKSQLGQ